MKVFETKDAILMIPKEMNNIQKEMNSNLKWMIATIVAAGGILIPVV